MCFPATKNLNGLRGEFTEEKTKYVDFLVKNEALTNDINALTKEKDELEVKNQELASANEAKKSDLQTQQIRFGGIAIQEQGYGKYPSHC